MSQRHIAKLDNIHTALLNRHCTVCLSEGDLGKMPAFSHALGKSVQFPQYTSNHSSHSSIIVDGIYAMPFTVRKVQLQYSRQTIRASMSCQPHVQKRARSDYKSFRLLAATGNPIELAEKDVEFLSSLGGKLSSAVSKTPKEDATASLRAAADDLSAVERPPNSAQSPSVKVKLLSGRIKNGESSGTDVVLKVYPPASGSNTDLLVRNEVAAHASLQQLFLGTAVPGSERISHLMGFFTRASGEQVLVFRKDFSETVEEYCCQSASSLFERGDAAYWQRSENAHAVERRKTVVKAMMRQLLEGLAFMHRRERIHQKLEPRNAVLSGTQGGGAELLQVRLQDLALSADISDAALLGGATLAELWQGKKEHDNPLKALQEPIWKRAKQAGAESAREQQLFAVSEDILSAGLLVAYLAVVPFCAPESVDFAVIQRLLGVTFQAELGAAREYCEADDRWQLAVAFLNEDIGSGWDLIQSMIFPDFRLRPTAESCLIHPFLKRHV